MTKQLSAALALLLATGGVAYAQTIRFDKPKSEFLATFCGGDGYEASAEYSRWMSRSLNQTRAAGISDRDALVALEISHCVPALWVDMTATEKSQFCNGNELSGTYAVRLNDVLRRAEAVGLDSREAIAVVRSLNCDTELLSGAR
ncbi:hypothetical protein [Caldimonas brevitalea]|uniref:hypothetical protein n=1 Tax=Caldimonas brevitalea TaxID=413882 RepID=UPI0012FB1E75|nr:hypothetical protein [Caldimonas brevitalea]